MANFCIECGAKMEPTAKFCTQCGTKVAVIVEPEPKKESTVLPPPLPVMPTDQVRSTVPPPIPALGVDQQDDISRQINALASDLLKVTAAGKDLYELESNSESKWLMGKVKMTYEGRIKLERDKKTIIFWDMIKKTSSGWGGDDMGFSSEKFIIKGLERSGGGLGFVPTGNTYNYDFGRMREVVKQLAETCGWKFKTTLFKPK